MEHILVLYTTYKARASESNLYAHRALSLVKDDIFYEKREREKGSMGPSSPLMI